MSTEITTVNVNILDRTYAIKCPAAKIAELQQAAQHLDAKMRQIQGNNKFISIDKVAIIAAINIASEALAANSENNSIIDATNNRILSLQKKIEDVLDNTVTS